ncbi:winged helix-turn-helix domain-containing protein [Haloglomus litoreum]|uniref:winged helix-turn-helix domain-containing protein n=1 Tax=Haloglomus litoreum TaxID=3034026 RepID=UPI0023E84228|nr:helix-turn-helix domain-containing protein [Haloglomus sp. DT116]
MNGASMTVPTPRTRNDDMILLEADEPVETVLGALEDADCRAILDATSEDALTASEVAAACDLPTSTTYRKLDRLADAALIEERVRIRRSGKHASEYVRAVDDVVVTVGSGGVAVRLSQADPTRDTPAAFGALAD